tara:strand:- start:63 stop:269 length:207 start_codon:yes stop_codon:yes gene_type:complete
MNDKKIISISPTLFNKVEQRIQNPQTGFSSVDEYVEYVLTELFDGDENETNEEESKQIQEELKKLGYI